MAEFYRAIRRKAHEMKSLPRSIDAYKRVPSRSCQTCPFAFQCIGDLHALPLYDMAIEQLIETAYLAAGVEAQCKEAIKAYLLASKEDEVYAKGNGYRISWSATMREAKQKVKKGDTNE